MLNRLSETKLFTLGNMKYDYTTGLSKINFQDYYIPEDFYIDKIKAFKGFKYPLMSEIIDAITNHKIIPVDFAQANNKNCKVQDMRLVTKWPTFIYNMEIMNEKGEIVILMDLSSKGKYSINPTTKELFYYSIDDTILVAMCTAAYISYKLSNKPDLANNPELFDLISDAYALIMDKVFSPMLSTNSITDASKIHLLCYTFCAQTMFGIDKDLALKYAKKSKFVTDKNGVMDSCFYYNTDVDIIDDCDYKTVFPIDNFCKLICKEFSYITENICNPGKLVKQFDDWFNRNATFTLEHSKSFITMLVFSKYGIDIFNNFRLKNFLAMSSSDIIKDLASIVK